VVDGYGIDPSKITVIPPGVTPALWRRSDPSGEGDGVFRILFVGGDLERKGGVELIDVVQALRDVGGPKGVQIELDLVTHADVPQRPGIRVHRGMTPNSAELVALFHRADVFALPTKADCLGLALLEGAAAGLPLVSTSVAGVPEIVVDGETGLVVPPGDRAALSAALLRLIEDEGLRRRLGTGAAACVAARFDAETNTERLIDLLVEVAQSRPSGLPAQP
jgi:glycosyltransferase involved in cell wall biosynthesis